MSELKTKPNNTDVDTYISRIEHSTRKADAKVLLELFSKVTEQAPIMWGDSIIGFGNYSYRNSKGEYNWLMTGFSPRKSNLTLYVMQGFSTFSDELLTLGKIKHAKSCLYINKLSDIDLNALEQFLIKVVADMRAKYQCS
ncbi:DUF1801 domain-containing protein [Pseudoalteromonas simplex]|uniref:DUF1801 domain-containing protein n=1 Tax=Pseudoalteromonas simplex TaxID=2783613 RepID=UPI001887CA40|nr:DUF1801 domain-containing protein [Pseudoalteromonas sp. A520]